MKGLSIILLLLSSSPALAWDGYDTQSGSYVDIEQGNNIKRGKDIDVYDSKTGQYNNVEVQEVRGHGSSTEVDVYDYKTGQYKTLEMDR